MTQDVHAGQATQRHSLTSKYLPEFVYGGIDGLVTTFAVVAGATGASLNLDVVLILGFANLFADGFSMSVGAYLANKSDRDMYRRKLAQEQQKIRTQRDLEIQETTEIYRAKGFEGELLAHAVEVTIADPDRRVDVLMKEKLELSEPDKEPFMVGLSTFTAFVLIGLIPLLTYIISYVADLDPASLFPLSVALTALGFLGIGFMKSYVNQTSRWKAMLETVTLGGIAAAVAYYVGFVLEKIIVGG